MIYDSETGNLSVTLAGDTLLTRRLSIFNEAGFTKLADIFRNSDVGFANLESPVRNWNEGTPGVSRGTYMTTPPDLVADLKWFGINLVSCANNHASDYGEGGVMATVRHLDEAKLAHSGSGHNLDHARAPGYLDTIHGRVGLISATSHFRPWHSAGAQRRDLPGRPGINPLSWKRTYCVDEEAFAQLRRMSKELGFDQERNRARGHFFSDKELPPDKKDEIELFGARLVCGSGFVETNEIDSSDAKDNLKWTREARRQADWVIVSLHYHQFGGESLKRAKDRTGIEEPADFIVDFAHDAIDAGADIFVGHGPHIPLGIEIYKGRPILYSLGNFIFQNETVPFFPEEAYSRFDLGPDATPADFLDARTDGGKKGHPARVGFWENIVVQCVFTKGALTEIRIHPIDQGFGRPRAQRGRPVMAEGEVAQRILERIARLSIRYGTQMNISDNTGVILVKGIG
jgi:poly-gamma-glutamate capsule biosynthesis protein CapA/YwtB (metallophosphatase superfamily)